jgi:DNA-binding transcriptional ArsR family regulator
MRPRANKRSTADVLQVVRANGGTTHDLAASLGMSFSAVKMHLYKLRKRKSVESFRDGRRGNDDQVLWIAVPDDDEDLVPIVQRIVPASTAPRLRPAGPASVWELAA